MTKKTRNTVPWWIRPETKERLEKHGDMNDTQDSVTNKVLDRLEELEEKLAKAERDLKTLRRLDEMEPKKKAGAAKRKQM